MPDAIIVGGRTGRDGDGPRPAPGRHRRDGARGRPWPVPTTLGAWLTLAGNGLDALAHARAGRRRVRRRAFPTPLA